MVKTISSVGMASLFLLSLGACSSESSEPAATVTSPKRVSLAEGDAGKFDEPTPGKMTTLFLHDLLDLDERIPLEASGLSIAFDDTFEAPVHVVFDHFEAVATLPMTLGTATLTGDEDIDEGYEGLTYDASTDTFYALVEAVEKKKHNEPEIHVYDRDWNRLAKHQVDFELDDFNKGMEGLAHTYIADTLYLLMLCEGNECKTNGEKGEGRIQAFTLDEEGEEWLHVDTIKLPESLHFEDYSGIDLRGDSLIITSQEESAIWMGSLTLELDENGEPDWKIQDEGTIFELPRNNDDKKIYCNVEGVSFSDDGKSIYLASDRRKPDQNKRCEKGDQALHQILLP